MQIQFNNGGGCSGCLTIIGGLVVLFFVLSICGALVN